MSVDQDLNGDRAGGGAIARVEGRSRCGGAIALWRGDRVVGWRSRG
jgi:hypothetical protein